MMRIAFADFSGMDFHVASVDSRLLGGSQSAACYLARAMARQGQEVWFVSNTSQPGNHDGVNSLSWHTVRPIELRALGLDAFVCILAAGRGALFREILGADTRLVLWNQHAP